jgi:Putative Na+/H+ antiporter
MRRHRTPLIKTWLLLVVLPCLLCSAVPARAARPATDQKFPLSNDSYQDDSISSLGGKLITRIQREPFNAAGTVIFFAAIIHTFLASRFQKIAHEYDLLARAIEDLDPLKRDQRGKEWDGLLFRAQFFHFMGEIEAVFGIWLAILTIGPLLGSFITEPAAMTISALLLRRRFYNLHPSAHLKYATLGLLFVNVSVGGTLTHFAAPPVVIVASHWNWDLLFMMQNFGWKAVIAILVSNFLFFLFFRKELTRLAAEPDAEEPVQERREVPWSIIFIHLLFLAWTVVNAHYPTLIIFGFLFFLAFVTATRRSQHQIALRQALLVGFFLGSLVIHGGCQEWWIVPVLRELSEWPMMIGATVLTAFNDNAAVTYLASLVPAI